MIIRKLAFLTFLATGFCNTVLAASFSGSYSTLNNFGQPVELVLQADPDGEVIGSLRAQGQQFIVEARQNGERLEGVVYLQGASAGEESYLEAVLVHNRLQFLIMNPGADGMPDPATRSVLVFDRDKTPAAGSAASLAEALGIGAGAESAPDASQDRVIASGAAGQLTEAGFDAYMEALAFCLQQIGDPTRIDAATRAQFRENMVRAYPGLPAEVQQNLANSTRIWDRYRQSWNAISLEQKKEFAYGVLALAYGEQAAAQALGVSGGGASSGGGSSYYSQGGAGGYGSYASDGKCSYFSSEAGSISTCD